MAGPVPTTHSNHKDRSAGPVHSSGWLGHAVLRKRLRMNTVADIVFPQDDVQPCAAVNAHQAVNVEMKVSIVRRIYFSKLADCLRQPQVISFAAEHVYLQAALQRTLVRRT